MAQVADFVGTEPWLIGDPPERVAAIEIGDLSEPVVVTEPLQRLDVGSAFLPNVDRPFPPAAFGFMVEPGEENEVELISYDMLKPDAMIIGALYPEALYLEPTIGQIWPR